MKGACAPAMAKNPSAAGTAWLKPVLWLSLGAWIALIFLFSSQSYQTQTIKPALERSFSAEQAAALLPSLGFTYNRHEYDTAADPYDVLEFIFRKSAHLFVYAVLAGIAWSLQRCYRIYPPVLLFNVVALTLLIACGDELNQQFSTMRTPNPEDVLIDLIGGSLGVFILYSCSIGLRWSRSLSGRIF
ncbi:VanZ family protein [Paenibacillus sp. P22]|nr:VanZ family protein [Paenibacillus sp. P22]